MDHLYDFICKISLYSMHGACMLYPHPAKPSNKSNGRNLQVTGLLSNARTMISEGRWRTELVKSLKDEAPLGGVYFYATSMKMYKASDSTQTYIICKISYIFKPVYIYICSQNRLNVTLMFVLLTQLKQHRQFEHEHPSCCMHFGSGVYPNHRI